MKIRVLCAIAVGLVLIMNGRSGSVANTSVASEAMPEIASVIDDSQDIKLAEQ